MAEDVLAVLAGLGGLGGFISILVNVLKRFGVVLDGTADMWVKGLNLLAFIGVSVVYFLNVPVDWGGVNSVLVFGTTLLGFVVQLLGSRVTYTAVKGMPVIGFSHSEG